MDLAGEYRIPANRQRVWEALNDPDILRDCIPGCQSLDKEADDTLAAKVAISIGPIKATMNGKVTLSNIDAPNSYTITGEGRGAAAGFARGSADVELADHGSETVLSYKAHGQVGGRLAQVGARLVDAAAADLAGRFFTAFSEKLAGGPLQRAEHAVEHAIEEVAHQVSDAAHEIEEVADDAATRNVLGGPAMWGLIVIVLLVLGIILTR